MKTLKKLIAIAISLAMVLGSVTVTGFAEENTVEVTVGEETISYKDLETAVNTALHTSETAITATIKLLADQDLGTNRLDPRQPDSTTRNNCVRNLTFDLNGKTVTYSGTKRGWIQISNNSNYVIKNGTVNTTDREFIGSAGSSSSGSKITLEDLTWKTTISSGATYTWQYGNQEIEIISGTFNLDPTGYTRNEVTDNQDGSWTVVDTGFEPVVEATVEVTIDGETTGYRDLKTAVKEAFCVDDESITATIKLLSDQNLGNTRLDPRQPDSSTRNNCVRNLTFDLNGKTISYSGSSNGWIQISNASTYIIKNGTIDTGISPFIGSTTANATGSVIILSDITWKRIQYYLEWQYGKQTIIVLSGTYSDDPTHYTSGDIEYNSDGTWTVTEKLSGEENDNTFWEFDLSTFTLTISGQGDMRDYGREYIWEFEDYYGNTPWMCYSRIIENVIFENGVTSIGKYACYKFDKLSKITIPGGIKGIKYLAISECQNLSNIIIEEGVEWIDDNAFMDCPKLQSIVVAASVTDIGECPFGYNVIVYGYDGSYAEEYFLDFGYKFISLSESVDVNGKKYSLAEGMEAAKKVDGRATITLLDDIRIIDHFDLRGGTCNDFVINLNGKNITKKTSNNDKLGLFVYSGSLCIRGSGTVIDDTRLNENGRFLVTQEEGAILKIDGGIFEHFTRPATNVSMTKPGAGTILSSGTFSFDPNAEFSKCMLAEGCEVSGKNPWTVSKKSVSDSMVNISFDKYFLEKDETATVTISFTEEILVKTISIEATIPKGLYIRSGDWNICGTINNTIQYSTVSLFEASRGAASFYDNAISSGEVIEFKVVAKEKTSLLDLGFKTIVRIKEDGVEVKSFEDESFIEAVPECVQLGYFGENNLFWILDDEGTLTISGNGNMEIYRQPWGNYCDLIKKVIICDGITNIGEGAFEFCGSLTEVDIAESVTSIDNNAFYGCENLKQFTIPKGVTNIGAYAFSECSGLISISLPDNLETIGYNAFSYCSLLTEIVIPQNVKYIDSEVFMCCRGLESIIIPEGVKNIGSYGFYGCENLTNVTLPESLTSIFEQAFGECDKLTSITILENVVEIIEDAFDTSLETIYGYAGTYAEIYADWYGYNFENIGEEASGFCGADGGNLAWAYDVDTSTLTISGIGAMYDYGYGQAPWFDFTDFKKNTIMVNEGVTRICNYAFESGWGNDIILPTTITSIGYDGTGEPGSNNITYNGLFSDAEKIIFDDEEERLLRLWQYPNDPTYYKCGDNLLWKLNEGRLYISGTGAMYDYDNYNQAPWYDIIDYIYEPEIIIGEGITYIGEYAFEGEDGNITLPITITSIGYNALGNNYITYSGLISDAKLIAFDSRNGYNINLWQYPNDPEYSKLYYKCGENLTWSYDEDTNTITISGTGEMYDYTKRGEAPWHNKVGYYETIYVNISEDVTRIGNHAFASQIQDGESLHYNITLPTTISSIGKFGFGDNYLIIYSGQKEDAKSITFDNEGEYNCAQWKYPNDPEFCKCGDNLTWSYDEKAKELTITGTGAMYDYSNYDETPWSGLVYNSENEIVIGEGVTHIGKYAFAGDWNNNIILPTTITSIGDNGLGHEGNHIIFYNGSMDSAKLILINSENEYDVAKWKYPNDPGFYKCGENLVWQCDKDTNTVTISGTGAMYDYGSYNESPWCGLAAHSGSKIIVGEGVTHIGDYAFEYGWDNTIILPTTITSIGKRSFGWNGDHTIIYNGLIAGAERILFNSENEYDITRWKYPNDPEFYKCGENLTWQYDENTKTLTISGNGEMYDYYSGTMPWSTLAFENVILLRGVTKIGDFAFCELRSLKTVTIPEGVTRIGEYAFGFCSELTEIILPESLLSIGELAFYDCDSLTSITIPKDIVTIGGRYGGAFDGCYNLSSVTFEEGMKKIPDYAFEGCSGLTEVTIPKSVVEIGECAFGSGRFYIETVYGYKGTYAEEYAKMKGCKFIPLSDISIGDITAAGAIGESLKLSLDIEIEGGDESGAYKVTYLNPETNKVEEIDYKIDKGVMSIDIENIYLYYLANDLNIKINGEVIHYSLLDYYNALAKADPENEELLSLLANLIVFARELVLGSTDGNPSTIAGITSIELPDWVEQSKTTYAPETTSDNEKKILESNVGKATENSAKIVSANINLTDKARPAFYVKNTTCETIYLDINGEEYDVGIGEKVRIDTTAKFSPLAYDDQIIATLKLADGTVAHKVQYSVNAYCVSKAGSSASFGNTTVGDVAASLYNYGLAAKSYLVK